MSFVSSTVPALIKISVNKSFSAIKPDMIPAPMSGRGPTVANIKQKAVARLRRSATKRVTFKLPAFTGSVFVLSISMS
jgi:hypothetical protein